MGCREFFNMSTICRAEVSRYRVLPSVSRWYSDPAVTVSARRLLNSRCKKRITFRNALQRKSAAAQLAYNRHLGYVLHRIQTPVPLVAWNDDAALIPPLQLPRRDS